MHNVIVAGYEGGLEVFAVSKRGLHKVMNMDGLRGGVFHAKILPLNMGRGKSSPLPLIAVVVHGPVSQSLAVLSSYFKLLQERRASESLK